MILSNATKQHKVIVTSLKTICLIRCHRTVDDTTTFLVEGVVGAKESEIIENLPWVFDGWSLPQSIELNRDLYGWSECGLKVTLEAKCKAKKGRHLDVVCILTATPSVKDDTEFDLHVALWLTSEVLEKIAPCLLKSYNTDPGMYFSDKGNSKKLIATQRCYRFEESHGS
jgi:hypothetical protein